MGQFIEVSYTTNLVMSLPKREVGRIYSASIRGHLIFCKDTKKFSNFQIFRSLFSIKNVKKSVFILSL